MFYQFFGGYYKNTGYSGALLQKPYISLSISTIKYGSLTYEHLVFT